MGPLIPRCAGASSAAFGLLAALALGCGGSASPPPVETRPPLLASLDHVPFVGNLVAGCLGAAGGVIEGLDLDAVINGLLSPLVVAGEQLTLDRILFGIDPLGLPVVGALLVSLGGAEPLTPLSPEDATAILSVGDLGLELPVVGQLATVCSGVPTPEPVVTNVVDSLVEVLGIVPLLLDAGGGTETRVVGLLVATRGSGS